MSDRERALLVGMLVDAIEALVAGGDGAAAQRARDARAWIEADEPAWPFSFTTVCRVLELDAAGLRAALLVTSPPLTSPPLPVRNAPVRRS